MSTPKHGKSRKPTFKGTASDFIRTFSSETPAKEITRKGLIRGLKFSEGLVYAVRSYDRQNRQKKAKGTLVAAGSPTTRLRALMQQVGLRTSVRVLGSLIKEAA